ncbi:hypothetical protein [Vibrio navarrensis]|uniref:hypothetical protein n=1 Tax=Vibrio navarrensis TaxID=29495 RepID=UPI0018CDDB86|nr:hypothetical protein [Vibrio navarrensis]EJK2113988.1 hypothetical protein [Vibrio navarrensis]
MIIRIRCGALAVEQNSYELYFRCAFENINAFASGKAQNIANPETLTAQISAI